MHGSTALAEALSPDDYLKALNDYFECSAGAVIANDGEVLLLLGDAVLAIFPIERQARATRRAPRTDRPLTHFASPRGEKCGQAAEAA